MRDPMLITFAKDMLGMTDEDIAKIPADRDREYLNAIQNLAKYRLVAEVVKSKYCAAGVQVGQKIVLNGVQIDRDASDCPLCVGALGPLARSLAIYLDRCYHDRDLEAPLSGFACLDPGLEVDGLGHVLFSLKIERVA